MRCRFKIFCFLALAAILFNGAAPRWPSWIFDQHNFSLFRSRSHPVAKEQVSAQSDLRFEKRCRKLIFKMAAVVVILFVLRFYGPVNPMGSCRARSVYLTTRLLGRLTPLSG